MASDMNSRYTRRLQKELMDIQKNPPTGIAVQEVTSLHKWRIHADGAQGSVYEGEKFELQFIFPQNYPLEAPEVIFVGNHVPIHPHVYSNGHICLSILYDGWSPALSVTSVVLSILSMLSSCTDKTMIHTYEMQLEGVLKIHDGGFTTTRFEVNSELSRVLVNHNAN